eukprot:4826698-Alexandrium_andersonii.AAC.1
MRRGCCRFDVRLWAFWFAVWHVAQAFLQDGVCGTLMSVVRVRGTSDGYVPSGARQTVDMQ